MHVIVDSFKVDGENETSAVEQIGTTTGRTKTIPRRSNVNSLRIKIKWFEKIEREHLTKLNTIPLYRFKVIYLTHGRMPKDAIAAVLRRRFFKKPKRGREKEFGRPMLKNLISSRNILLESAILRPLVQCEDEGQ